MQLLTPSELRKMLQESGNTETDDYGVCESDESNIDSQDTSQDTSFCL